MLSWWIFASGRIIADEISGLDLLMLSWAIMEEPKEKKKLQRSTSVGHFQSILDTFKPQDFCWNCTASGTQGLFIGVHCIGGASK
uniref:Uncharacterized protein n=1 Tax=Arundo donax TaxID=35708 RepID=A0A0A8Z1H2_ARUDO